MTRLSGSRLLLVVALSVCTSAALGEAKARKGPAKASGPGVTHEPRSLAGAEKPDATKLATTVDDPSMRLYSYKLNTFLGLHLAGNSALSLGGQFARLLDDLGTIYGGVELDFSVFSDGRILTPLLGAWYELRVAGAPRLSLGVGGLAGVGFNSGVAGQPSTALALYLDTFISQDVDDLVSVRGQLRPGILGKHFSFLMAFSMTFRFL